MNERIDGLISRIEAIKEQDPMGENSSYDTELKRLNRDIKVLRAALMIMAGVDNEQAINYCINSAAEFATA